MSIFEILMLLCFGAAWPVAIYKCWKAKSVEGRSIIFLFIVLIGYLSGIMHKAFFNFDSIIYLYIVNAIMVSVNIALYYKYRKL